MTQQKKIINAAVDEFSPYRLEGSLKDLKEQVLEWITLYGEDATMAYSQNYYEYGDNEATPMLFIKKDRLETDQECETRMAQKAEMALWQENRELAEFVRLKKKFGQ